MYLKIFLMPFLFFTVLSGCKKDKEINVISPAYRISESEKLVIPAAVDIPANLPTGNTSDVSQNLTDDQKAMAVFWRDVTGITSPGLWLSILQQVIGSNKTSLDEAALTYAFTCAAINDTLIRCFRAKYQYNLDRPVTCIREIMGNTSWNSYPGTPAHPEYVSAHASLSAAAADVLEKLFNNDGYLQITRTITSGLLQELILPLPLLAWKRGNRDCMQEFITRSALMQVWYKAEK